MWRQDDNIRRVAMFISAAVLIISAMVSYGEDLSDALSSGRENAKEQPANP